MLERIDRVTSLNFPSVPSSDLADWDEFLSWALSGQQWTYAPDSTEPATFTTFYLVNTDVPYKRVGFELYSISLKVRQVVTAEIGS